MLQPSQEKGGWGGGGAWRCEADSRRLTNARQQRMTVVRGEESGAWLASDGVTATKTTVLTRFRSPQSFTPVTFNLTKASFTLFTG